MRKRTRVLAIVVGLVLAFATGAAKAGGNGAAAFEQMKSLVGHWETEKSNTNKATLDIELTSGGSALIERARMEDNGKPVEMITLYYVDGDQLKLTHYCMAGNQPTMVATYTPETKTFKFDFASITNLKSPDAGHMHHAVYTLIDSDHFKTIWTFRKDQKDAFSEDATYVRVK
jgi:uncharacterized protein (TIGR03066 family)